MAAILKLRALSGHSSELFLIMSLLLLAGIEPNPGPTFESFGRVRSLSATFFNGNKFCDFLFAFLDDVGLPMWGFLFKGKSVKENNVSIL